MLRARGLEIGLTDYRDLGLLLSRYDGCSRDVLRTAIAALLARDRVERKLIADCFDDLFVDFQPPAPPTPGPPPELPSADRAPAASTGGVHPLRWRWIQSSPWTPVAIAAGVLLLATLIVPIMLALTTAPALPAFPAARPLAQPTALASTVEPVPVPEPEPSEPTPPLKRQWSTLLFPAAIAFAVILALRIGRRTVLRRSSQIRSGRQSQLAAIAGPRFYRWRVDNRVSAIPRDVVEEVATILGRRHELARTSNHLDVDRTIRRTLEAGLFPHFVFEPPCRTLPLLVLQDIGADMRLWRARIDHLIDDLGRLGVPIWRYYFDVTANYVWRSQSDSGTTLDLLSKSADDAALMVVSAGAGIRAALSDRSERSWLRLLVKWPARTWVTPLTSRAHWRAELADVPMPVWPMTPGGLHAAARELLLDATHRPTAPPDALAGARRVSRDDLERVKRLVALAPPPVPVDLVNALRVRFTPDVPADVLLPLLAENESLDSSAVRLPDAEVTRLLAAIGRDNPDREAEVRHFLVGLLEASEPPKDSVAYLRWRTDLALHQALLADQAGDTPSDPLAQLESLVSGPLRDEVRSRAAQVAGSGRVVKPLERMRNVPAAPVPTEAASEAAAPRLPVLKSHDAVVAVAGAALAVATFVAASGVDRRQVDHQRDVWSLAWDPARQALTGTSASADAPQRIVWLVRDGARLAPVSLPRAGSGLVRDHLADRGETGSWYQLQAPLPEGNLALSNAVWVPGPLKPGRVLATFRSADGQRVNVRYTLTARDGRSVNGSAGSPVDVAPGDWTLGVQVQGYQALYEPVTVQSGRELQREFTLTANTSGQTSPGGVRITLVDVYGDPASVIVIRGDLRGVQKGGKALDWTLFQGVVSRTGATVSSGVQANDIDWTLGPVQVDVRSPLYEPATFSVVGKPSETVLRRQTLLMRPGRARPDFPSDLPKGIQVLYGQNRSVQPPDDPLARANLLNTFDGARNVIVTLDRPQGTFSRALWLLLDQMDGVTPTSLQAFVAPEYEAYLDTWIRLGWQGTRPDQKTADALRPGNAQPQQAQRQSPQQAPPTASVQRLSIPLRRGDRVILDLELRPGGAAGRSGGLLKLSLRPTSGNDPHPYLMHQLLVQEGYTALYRLHVGGLAMKK